MNAAARQFRTASLGLVIVAGGAFGCGGPDEQDDLAIQTGQIQAGKLETGYPMVGMLESDTANGPHICTGTLVSQSYVLTAAHCTGTNMVFRTGTTWSNFVDHPVDQQIRHPQRDLMLVHLATPLDGVPVLHVNEAAPPMVNTVCTAVGFGDFTDANGVATNGTKRSATVKVLFTGALNITVEMVSGIPDGGDSGGPLLCNGIIAGAVQGHIDGDWPQHKQDIYTTVDAPWIASTIAPVYTELTLQNGWTNAPFSTRNAAAALVSGNVQFKGAISTAGTNPVAFTLPAALRPPANVYVPVDLCGAARGRLFIQPSGVVTVQAESFSSAQCFTSLEGVSFVSSFLGLTPLTLQNGWTNAPSGTSNASVITTGGVVQFRGAIATTGTNQTPFTLPPEFRPSVSVYVPVALCNSKKGRLFIPSSGVVTVVSESAWSDVQCMTSLDGASFALSTTGFSLLSLQNGWTGAASGTAQPAIEVLSGVVRFKGAIASGTSPTAFTLPFGVRPATAVYVPIDLCNAHKGRLIIQPTGAVDVQALSSFSDAQCFTSLDSAAFVLSDFTPLTLESGWTGAVFNTARPGFAVSAGIVQLRGAMATSGTDPTPFILPSGVRPPTDVYLPIAVCNANKGRLRIQPSGVVTVSVDGLFSDAQCLTSLDGVSFALSATGFTALTLQNGWTNAPFSTRNAAVVDTAGVVRFQGAIASGTSSVLFTLPSAFRPPAAVYLPVDLCAGGKGRLIIAANGSTSVEVDGGAFSRAACFTSLEGVTFAKAAGAPLSLVNGWTNAAFATRGPGATSALGIVRLQGAITSGTSGFAFTLPVALRPSAITYVAIDLCAAKKGRLELQVGGNVFVVNGEGTFAGTAACFTSLEGVSFAQ